MQVLVMYYSVSGNTKKLAESVAKGVKEVSAVECVLKEASEITRDDFLSCDAIIAGSPVYFGTMAGEIKKVFDENVGVRKNMEGKIGAAFTTSGNVSGGKETTMISIIQAMMIYGMLIVGDPMSATGHYGTACVGAPDREAADNAVKLGRRVAEVTKKLRS